MITTANLTESALKDLKRFQEELAKNEELTASLNIVDNEELKRRYDLAIERESPLINFSLELEPNKYVSMKVAGTHAITAAISLKECIKFSGIKDGTLFQKNVRQSLGLNNRVNKNLEDTYIMFRFYEIPRIFYH